MTQQLFAAIEAGGTKVICAIAGADGGVLVQARLPTTAPDDTFACIATFFHQQIDRLGRIAAGGIASFGPLDLDPISLQFGQLTTTPKPGWAAVDMLGRVAAILDAPTFINTDVTCAAMAEANVGAGRGLDRLCYMTVGTGIGVGIFDRGATPAGALHPEVGHVRISRAQGDDFAGICPSHGDCAEGLACGPAMKTRWHKSAEELPADHIAWAYEAHYIAAICVNLTYIVRPQRIIIGGGVMEQSSLIGAVRSAYRELMAGYALDRYSVAVETFICLPELRNPSPGLIGALEIARSGLAALHVPAHG